VEGVQLWQKVQHFGRMSLDTWSIHKLHLIQLKHTESVNPSLWRHLQLVLKPKQSGKTSNSDLISPPICHPHKLLCISVKVESGIKLTDDFLIPIILETHHFGHLQLITSSFDLVEYGVSLSCHPILVDPLRFHYGFLFVEVNRMVPIRVE
jgi:hypothetical protein